MAGFDRIAAHEFGGPQTLVLEHVADLPEPASAEVRVRVEAAGVGYTDTILRRGRYIGYIGGLPLTPGYDVVGRIDKLGPDVTEFRVGDRVADMSVHGAYSQYIVRPAVDFIPVPPGVDPTAAIEVPLMWVTAWQMLTRIASLPPRSEILVVGASGAAGRALAMLGGHLGHHVIGTCSASNVGLVERLGATAIDYVSPDLSAAINQVSGGEGVAAAFDAIGGDSWATSWRSLAPGGLLVAYGFQDFLESGGQPAEAGKWMTMLNQVWTKEGREDGTGRRTTFYDIRERRLLHPDDYRADAVHLLKLIADGELCPLEAEVLPLSSAADAHRRIAARGLHHRLVLAP